MIPPYPPTFDANARCEYHAGSPGHTIGYCKALKYKVQELIDSKLLTFKDKSQNVKNNLLPGHIGPSVNVVEESVEPGLIKEVGSVRTYVLIICEKLTEAGLIQEVHGICEVCLSTPDECEELKRCPQKQMKQGLVQISHVKNDESIAPGRDCRDSGSREQSASQLGAGFDPSCIFGLFCVRKGLFALKKLKLERYSNRSRFSFLRVFSFILCVTVHCFSCPNLRLNSYSAFTPTASD